MDATWKPAGYTSVSRYLIVELRRYEMPDGGVMHAEVLIDDSIVMIGDAGGEWLAAEGAVHIYVPDVDATYEQALAAGGTAVQRPEREPSDSDRRGAVRDPAGKIWWITAQVSPAALEAS